jgi:two-component system chemotaxis response regulator CheY
MAKILVVDDSRSMRQMVLFALKNAQFETSEACDGVEALEWAQNNPKVDLVLSDVNMPNMDGIELIKRLRGLPEYRFTPILMLTTESSDEKKMEGKNAGATGWIVKPFNPEKLIATINKVIHY